jgi:5-methylcytosine-specific restriction endonuclease McrA
MYNIEEVLEHVTYQGHLRSKTREYEGLVVLMNSRKLRVFAQKGTTCAFCKIKGEYFRLHKCEFGENRGFLQLYAVRNGSEVIMTVDHKVPRAKGGRNALENLQTMCADCNNIKGAMTGKKTQKWQNRVRYRILGHEPKPKTVEKVATDWDKWVQKEADV